jgi:outer membrane protein assembly factor BamB
VLKAGLLYGLTPANELFCLRAENGQVAWSAATAPATPPTSPPPGGAGAAEQPGTGGAPGGGQGGRGGGRGGRGGGGGSGYGSIVDGGSVLLTLTPSSELLAFQPSDKSYTELARIKVADTPTHAYPVVSKNRIFIKDKDSLTLWTID